MTTLSAPKSPATRPTAPRDGADEGRGSLLAQSDLDDPERFVTIPGVPLLDVHRHPRKGDVDLGMLRTHARNMEAGSDRGHFPAVTLGHLMPKETREVEKDGLKVRVLGVAEKDQPRVVGYASRGRVGRYLGRPCLFGDIHYHRHLYDESSEYPWVSVERLQPPDDDEADDPAEHTIDRVALLKTPPERPLGIIRYMQDDGRLVRVCYAGDFSPLNLPPLQPEDDDMPPPEAATATAPAMDPEAEKIVGALRAFMPELVEAIHAKLMEPGPEDNPDAEPDPGLDRQVEPEPVDTAGSGGDEEQRTGYEDDVEADEPPTAADEEQEGRVPYADAPAATEPGAGNTFLPTDGGACDGTSKGKRPREQERITMSRATATATQPASHGTGQARVEYGRLAKRVDEQDDMIAYLYGELKDAKDEKRRLKYERDLTDLREAENKDIDIEAELAELLPDSPDDFEARRLNLIRTRYSRRADAGRRPNLSIAAIDANMVAGKGLIQDRKQCEEVVDYALRKGISIPEAKKALGIGA